MIIRVVVLTAWGATTLAGIVGCAYVRLGLRDTRKGIWTTLLGAFPAWGLMLEYVVSSARDDVVQRNAMAQHSHLYDIPILLGAWGALLTGAFGIFESFEIAKPREVPAYVNVVRVPLILSWVLASFATIMDAVSI